MSGKKTEDCNILFCPHEIGGQMQLMAETLRRRGYFATAASYNQEWFGHINDINFNLAKEPGRWKRWFQTLSFFVWASMNYDIFHFFWGESLVSSRLHAHPDLPLLKRLGKRIVVHFRGLDVISLSYFDYLRDRTEGKCSVAPPMSLPRQQQSLRHWIRYADALLVSEPDLHVVVPGSMLVPQAIDLSLWQPQPVQKPSNGVLRVAHAPSMRRKKGTEYVERAVAELRSLGYRVELILIENVPFQQVKALYAEADIGIDQVLYGWYGKVSLELMAMGKPVICYIDEALREKYRPDLPIVSATPRDLTEKLKWLISDPIARCELARRGSEYVRRYHDAERVIDQCLEIYRACSQPRRAGACKDDLP
jgi:hypothetical protein